MKDLTTQELKDELTRRGYYTGNLWHIDDVKGRFEATNDQAQDVLNEVLQGSWIIEQIFESIDDCADEYKLKEINEAD
jgi:uncharacterized lipoprotein YajG